MAMPYCQFYEKRAARASSTSAAAIFLHPKSSTFTCHGLGGHFCTWELLQWHSVLFVERKIRECFTLSFERLKGTVDSNDVSSRREELL